MSVITYLSVITLNVNGINVLIKRHRVRDGIKKPKNLHYAAYDKLTLV